MRRFGFFWLICSVFFLVGQLLTLWSEVVFSRLFSVHDDIFSASLVEHGASFALPLISPVPVWGFACGAFFTFLSFETVARTSNEFLFLRNQIGPFLPRAFFLLCLFHTLAECPLIALRYVFSKPRYQAYPPEMQLYEMLSVLTFLAIIFALVWLFWNAHKTPILKT